MQESAFSQPESMSSSSSQSSIGSSHGIQTELAAESDIIIPKPRNISEVPQTFFSKICVALSHMYFYEKSNRIRLMTCLTPLIRRLLCLASVRIHLLKEMYPLTALHFWRMKLSLQK
jgi:hypothetical protein